MWPMLDVTNGSGQQLSLHDVEGTLVTRLWPAILYTSLMMLMGAMGNFTVCYIYGFRWQSTVTKTFIFSLAGLDLMNSLICMPTEIAILARMLSFKVPAWCKVTRFLTYTLNGASSLILVAIALDRWFKVCRPLRCFFTNRRAKIVCACAVGLAASLSWPSLVMYGALHVPIEGAGATGVMCLVSDHFIDTWWPLLFYTLYFCCYICLVVAITVLYSLIAMRLVQLKKQQKERIAAKFSGLRSSKLIFPSQESIALTNVRQTSNNVSDNHYEGKCFSSAEDEGDRDVQEILVAQDKALSGAELLPEENLRRKSVSFRLPRKSTSSENEGVSLYPAAIMKRQQPNGVLHTQLPAIVVDNQEGDEEEKTDGDERVEGLSRTGLQCHAWRQQCLAAYNEQNEESNAQSLLQRELVGVEADLRMSVDSIQSQGCPEKVQLLPADLDIRSYSSSHDDTDEFEQGLHFVADDDDIPWQDNPIAGENTPNCESAVKFSVDSVTGNHHPPDTGDGLYDDGRCSKEEDAGDEMGSESSLLSEKSKQRVQKTRSDSFALLSADTAANPKQRLHKTSSDTNLVVAERHNQGLTPARRSFLMPPGGYPGGHTPTSRLPTPTGSPGSGDGQNRSVPLSGKALLERLNKKMAYRPAKTTCMLFAISIVFVVSFLPFFCIVIARATQGRDFFTHLGEAGLIVVNIFIRSSFLSNAANPIIYGLCNKQFRTECRHLISCWYGRRRDVTLRVIEATDDALGSNG